MQPGKYLIYSDSRSPIDALQNIKKSNSSIFYIRDLCIKHPNKIRLMRVPGNAGFEGNECADRTAKDTHMIPSIMDYSALNSDISKNDLRYLAK